MDRLKILFLSSWYPNKLEPTNGNFVQRHAEAVARLHDVEVLHAIGDYFQKERYVFEEKKENGVRTVVVYYRKSHFSIFSFFQRMKAYQKGFEMMAFPDIVHGNIMQNNLLFARKLKKEKRIPYIVTEHWSQFLAVNRSKLNAKTFRVAKLISEEASFIVPVSHALKKDLEDLCLGNQFAVVENVVDTKLFAEKKRGTDGVFSFLHISNLVPLKNTEKIIRTAIRLRAHYSNFVLHLGGDGDLTPIISQIEAAQAQDYIFFFGEQKLEEVAERMQQSDCFLLFSDYENLPCVLLESMSTGTPVVASDVGGVSEIVQKGCGLLIEKTEEALYEAMEKMLLKTVSISNPSTLHSYIDGAFSEIEIAKKFSVVYRQVLKR